MPEKLDNKKKISTLKQQGWEIIMHQYFFIKFEVNETKKYHIPSSWSDL